MSNLTITIDDDLLRAARIKAVQQGTSVNEVCRRAIAAFALGDAAQAAARAQAKARAFWAHADAIPLGAGSGKKLSRDAMYDELLAEKSKPTRVR